MIQFVQKKFGNQKLVGAEIGVKEGNNAFSILNNLQFKQLVLVDNWEGSFNKFYPTVINRFGKREDVTLLRKTSVEASKEFPEKYFDFVYIDACHTYECVKEDIESWLPKVKTDGIFGGHDYGHHIHRCIGLEKAVNEFAEKTKYRVFHSKGYLLFSERESSDWWIGV